VETTVLQDHVVCCWCPARASPGYEMRRILWSAGRRRWWDD